MRQVTNLSLLSEKARQKGPEFLNLCVRTVSCVILKSCVRRALVRILFEDKVSSQSV